MSGSALRQLLEQPRADPLALELVGNRERRLGRLRIAEADVVPDADDACVGAIAHDADQRAALGPVRLDEAPHEAVAGDGEAVEAEEAAADGEVGEERHHRRARPLRSAVAGAAWSRRAG